jgi:hypothetical protein
MILSGVFLLVGLSAACGVLLLRPSGGGAGDFSSVPEVAPGVEMIPVQADVSSVFGVSAAPLMKSSSDVGGSTLNDAATRLATPNADVPADWLPGNADLTRARLLMSGLGVASRSIYAYPTDKGKLCAGLSGSTAGCLIGFPTKAPIDWTFIPPTDGEPAIVWGIAPDFVAHVTVIVKGEQHSATLRNNAYFFQASSADITAFDGLQLSLTDGTTRNIPLAF